MQCPDSDLAADREVDLASSICICRSNCCCNELSSDVEGIKLDMVIAESKQKKFLSNYSQEIDRIKSGQNNISNQLAGLNITVKRLKEANLANNVNNDVADDRLCFRGENVLPRDTLEVLTHELERSKGKISEYINSEDVQEKLHNSCIKIVTINANYETEETLNNITQGINQPNKHQQDLVASPAVLSNPQSGSDDQNDFDAPSSLEQQFETKPESGPVIKINLIYKGRGILRNKRNCSQVQMLLTHLHQSGKFILTLCLVLMIKISPINKVESILKSKRICYQV